MRKPIIKLPRALVVLFCLTMLWPAASLSVSALEREGKSGAAEEELAELEGRWRVMTHEENGREYSYGDNFQLYVIEKDKFTVRKRGEVLAEGTIELDARRSPKQLNFRLTTGQSDVIIYLRVGDYWIQCGRRDGKTRPTQFATGTPDGGAYMLVLKREKESQ